MSHSLTTLQLGLPAVGVDTCMALLSPSWALPIHPFTPPLTAIIEPFPFGRQGLKGKDSGLFPT